MARPTCTACTRNTRGGQLAVCYDCRDQARTRLHAIADAYDQLLEPRATIPGQRRRIGHARPAPMPDHIGDARYWALTTLSTWLTNSYPADRARATATIRPVTKALRDIEPNLLADDEHAATYLADLLDAEQTLTRALQPGRAPGLTITTHAGCGGSVTARTLTGTGRCTTCHLSAPVADWHAPDAHLTDEQAVRYLAVVHGRTIAAGTLRTWRHRGLLPPATRRGQLALTRRGDLDTAVLTTTAA